MLGKFRTKTEGWCLECAGSPCVCLLTYLKLRIKILKGGGKKRRSRSQLTTGGRGGEASIMGKMMRIRWVLDTSIKPLRLMPSTGAWGNSNTNTTRVLELPPDWGE